MKILFSYRTGKEAYTAGTQEPYSATPTELRCLLRAILSVKTDIAYIPHTQGMMEIDMKASPEFQIFGSWFIQDIDRIALGLEEMYSFVLEHFEGEERVRLRQFIDRALHEASDDELQRLWNSVDSDIYFPTAKHLRAMLTGARDRL